MHKKMLMAVLLLTTVLYVTACGKETETPTDVPAGSPSVESPSDESGTQDVAEDESPSNEPEVQDVAQEDSQSAEGTEGSEEDSQFAEEEEEEEEEEGPVFYIFSDMPIAAYEVTGLGVGRFESVNDGEILVEGAGGSSDYYIDYPLVRLTPGENKFIIFCMERLIDENGKYGDVATIHSPSGSSQWEAITYVCLETAYKTIGDFSIIERADTGDNYVYNEETDGGSFRSLLDPWLKWVKFAEIYHPDSPQDDSIYVIQVIAYPGSGNYEEIDNVLARLVAGFEELGATTVKEIPVEKALKRCHASVAEDDAD